MTDDQGNYKIVDLRPGTYSVFTLTGFSTFKHEGIELTTGFTATANAEDRMAGHRLRRKVRGGRSRNGRSSSARHAVWRR